MKRKIRNERTVKFTVPKRDLGHSDVDFEAYGLDGSLVGTLKVSQGGVLWKSSRKQTRKTIPWEVFNSVMRDYYSQARFTPRG